MIITNLKNLATNPLRKTALAIAEAGLDAIDIQKAIDQRIKLKNNKLSILGAMLEHSIDLNDYKKIFLIGIGKGSALTCVALAKILDEKLTIGIALDVQKPKLKIRNFKLEILTGSHPLPSPQNVIATQKIIELAKNAGENDLIISFICGGGSALFCGSKSELNASQTIFKELTKKGADILELNTIRKHLSEVKGGNLAKIAYPAKMISLIVSDVLGNDLSMVASGPTVFDKTTKRGAEKIIEKYQVLNSEYQVLETPKDKKYFKKVKNILFLSNREPVLAMREKAKKLGFKTKIYSLKLKGEAKNALLQLIKTAKIGEAVLAAGETTVSFENPKFQTPNPKLGKGGRNQEAVLGALVQAQDTILLSFSSDGHDNTEAAGAIGDFSTIEKAKKLNPKKFLENHDSFNFFKKTNDLIFIEPKTFNVSDLMLILKGK